MPFQKEIITVLIADDHPSWIEGVRSIISKASDIHVVGEVHDGDQIKKKVTQLLNWKNGSGKIILRQLHWY